MNQYRSKLNVESDPDEESNAESVSDSILDDTEPSDNDEPDWDQ